MENRKRFEPHELRRIPVVMDDKTSAAILRSSWEGRHFPQALDEAFGTMDEVLSLSLALVAKKEHFSLAPDEEENTQLLEILAHRADEKTPFRFLLNLADLLYQHPSGLYGFNASYTAKELVRLAEHQKRSE